jgi:hypothetical protein
VKKWDDLSSDKYWLLLTGRLKVRITVRVRLTVRARVRVSVGRNGTIYHLTSTGYC